MKLEYKSKALLPEFYLSLKHYSYIIQSPVTVPKPVSKKEENKLLYQQAAGVIEKFLHKCASNSEMRNKIQKQKCGPTLSNTLRCLSRKCEWMSRLLRPVEPWRGVPRSHLQFLIHFMSYQISANYNRAISSISTQKLFEKAVPMLRV